MKTFATPRLSCKTLPFSIRRISASTFAYLLEKYGSQVDQKGFWVNFLFKIVKKSLFYNACSAQRLYCEVFCIWSYYYFYLDFIALFFDWERFIIAERSFLLTWGFWVSGRIFLFFGALSKTSSNLLSKCNTHMKTFYKLYIEI